MSEKARYAAALCVIFITFFCIMMATARAETPLHRPVDVQFDGISVESALATLGERADVQFEYDAELVRGLHPVTYETEGQEAGRVAMRILYPRGLELGEIRGNRVRIVKRDPLDEQRPRREENYEFARKPEITRDGDRVTIAFETAGWCDVTIAIEDEQGDIIRHLASGVLGPNAPEPFVWNSKAQTVIWDGKNDKGEYVDDKDAVSVRVSLGLKPRFERTLHWSPERRDGRVLALAAGSEGMYVFDSGRAFDHIRLFDREARYQRTVYPFPADNLEEIPDLMWHTLPDDATIPVKPNAHQTTILKSGNFPNDYSREEGRYLGRGNTYDGKGGWSGRDLAVGESRLALAGVGLSRMGVDGSSAGLPLYGPEITQRLDDVIEFRTSGNIYFTHAYITPERAAFCPDEETLYLTRQMEYQRSGWGPTSRWGSHVVYRMAFAEDKEPEVFLGSRERGTENGQFNMPSDVATDAEGRIYVADHGNNRVQVFSPEGEWLQNIEIALPSDIAVHHRTGEIYVFCWPMPGKEGERGYTGTRSGRIGGVLPSYGDIKPTNVRLHKFSPLDDGAKPLAAWHIPTHAGEEVHGYHQPIGFGDYHATIDSWADPTTIWVVPGPLDPPRDRPADRWATENIIVLRETDDGLEEVRHFNREARRAVLRIGPPPHQRPRLYVNPADGMLYVGEGTSREGKSFQWVTRINPQTGRLRRVELPHNSEEMAFDLDGRIYLRTHDVITRFEMDPWREVPFDYGEEREREGYSDGGGDRSTEVLSGATFPGNRGWHQGGMHVNVHGDIIVGALYEVDPLSRAEDGRVHEGESFEPRMYPGRRYSPGGRFGGMLVHILDRHGQMVHADAVPGLMSMQHGVALDADRNVYLLAQRTRAYDGEAGWNPLSGTLMRLTPGQNRIRTVLGAPVEMDSPPARSPDLLRRRAWVEGAHWFYGDGGWSAGNSPAPSNCSCHNSRFVLDYFDRSFSPELARYNVGVVDSQGNLIMRVGQYGNVDDGMPLVKEGGPPNPRSIGGDEVALFHPAYLATHSDRRLFIADTGNARVVSVKLGYHTDELVRLKDVPDTGDTAN